MEEKRFPEYVLNITVYRVIHLLFKLLHTRNEDIEKTIKIYWIKHSVSN